MPTQLEYNLAKDDKLISSKYLFNEKSVIYGKINPHFAKVCYPKFVGLCSADAYPINPIEEKIKELRAEGYKVYAAMLDKTSVRADEIEKGGKLAFVVGNEGHGISSEVRNRCDGSVIIPMRENGAESLNAAVAASVLMWEHKRI